MNGAMVATWILALVASLPFAPQETRPAGVDAGQEAQPVTVDTAQEAQPVRVELDHEASYIAARTGKAGLFGFLGHEHGILATDWSASLCLDPRRPDSVRGEITVPVEGLRIDTPEALGAVELDRTVDAEQQQKLQAQMTGPEYLAGDEHERIRLDAKSLELDDDGSGTVGGDLTVRGIRRAISVPVEISGLAAGQPVVEGSFEVLHTDHGMEPESIAGVVKVADEVEVRFRLEGTVTDSPCAGS